MSTTDTAHPSDQATPHEAWQLDLQIRTLTAESRYELVAPLAERLLEIREAELGFEHADTLFAAGTLAESYIHLSQGSRAEALLERIIGAHEARAAAKPRELVQARNQLSKLYRRAGALDRAEAQLRRAMEVLQAAPERDFISFADTAHSLAHLLDDRGAHAEAETFCRTALQMREKIFGEDSLPVSEALGTLATLRHHQDDVEEAVRLNLRAVAIGEVKHGHDSPSLTIQLSNLGLLYNERGEPEKAVPVLERVKRILEAQGGPPTLTLGALFENLATSRELTGNHEEAVALARRALALREELLGPDHPDVGRSLNNLAAKLSYIPGTGPEAVPLMRRALHIAEASLGPENPLLAKMLYNLAGFCLAAGDLEESERHAQRSHEINRKLHGREHLELANTFVILSEVARRRGDLDRASELAFEALKIRQQHLGKRAGDVFDDVMRLGAIFVEMEEHEQARKQFELAIDIADRALAKEPDKVAKALLEHGRAALAEKKPKLAAISLRRCLMIREKLRGPVHLDVTEPLGDLAKAYVDLGKYGAAEELYAKLGKAFAANYPPDDPHTVLASMALGELCVKRKQHARAAALFEGALAVAAASFGEDSMQLLTVLEHTATAQVASGAFERAKDTASWQLRILMLQVSDPDDSALLSPVVTLADIAVKTHDVAEIERLVPWSMRLLKKRTEEVNAETAGRMRELERLRGGS